MIHLVTQANGVSALLFHVEHSEQQRWLYRWRICGAYPPEYLEWRCGESREARVMVQPEVAGCLLEAQWRLAETDEWSQATLRELGQGVAQFRLLARDGFFAPKGFRVVALVPGELVACYVFGPLELQPGQQAPISGRADGAFADNVLLAAGDFRSYSGALEVDNLGPSTGSLVEPSGEARLAATDGCASRRLFVRTRLVQFESTQPPTEP